MEGQNSQQNGGLSTQQRKNSNPRVAPVAKSRAVVVDEIPSSPPLAQESTQQDKDRNNADSEAETIVITPAKSRKTGAATTTIKHEEGSADEDENHRLEGSGASFLLPSSSASTTNLGKRKRQQGKKDHHHLPGNNNSLRSLPTSPTASKTNKHDSDDSRPASPIRKKANSVDVVEHDHHDPSSGEEADNHRKYRKTSLSVGSTQQRQHRRVSSVTTNGLSHKKRKIPAPIRSTDFHPQSDASDGSSSPHPRSSRLRKTPATADSSHSNIMPPKMTRRRDGIGRTQLARAAANNDLATATSILEHSVEDIDVPDYAGNTPLQIASLEGHAEIVNLLISNGCDIHCINSDHDTPLLDSVENGHLDVVKLLLEAGVNPKKPNIRGEEPIDRIPEDADNPDEIRKELTAARLRYTNQHEDERSSHETNSPRHSPPVQTQHGGRRPKTSNRLLHQEINAKTLRMAAEVGDTETVNRLLQAREGLRADTDSLIVACRGGHFTTIQLLLAIGRADPDPQPLPPKSGFPSDQSTPMLAAIGRGVVEVLKLLLELPNFDPRRTFNGETYPEIARRRQGRRWQEEEEVLKEAYKNYSGPRKPPLDRVRSPEAQRNGKRSNNRAEMKSPSQKTTDVPRSEVEKRPKSGSSSTDVLKREPKKSSPTEAKTSPSSKNPSLDSTGLGPPRTKIIKKKSDDVPHSSSDNDPVKPRKRLMSGKEIKGEKEKQRRESAASPASFTANDASESRPGDSNKTDSKAHPSNYVEPDLGMDRPDKFPHRQRTLKREDSKDRLGAIRSESPAAKRPRESSTPPRAGSHDSSRTAEDSGLPAKKRRLDSEGHASSPDNRTGNSLFKSSNVGKERNRQGSVASQGQGKSLDAQSQAKKKTLTLQNKTPTSSSQEASGSAANSKSLESTGPSSKAQRETTDFKESIKVVDRKVVDERVAKSKAEREERRRQEEEKAEKAAAEELKRKEAARAAAEELKRKEAEKAEAEERARREAQAKLEEERLKQQREEEERQAILAEKRAREEEEARQLEAKLKQEEAERKERQARDDAVARQRAEEENRRLYLEQEQKKREEAERKRAAREAEALAERERVEAERRAKLPLLLRSFETYPAPQTPEFASLFAHFLGFRYDTINYATAGTPEGKELWILNTQVVFLLGLNDKDDLQLSRFTGWERFPAPDTAKKVLCAVELDWYACRNPKLQFLNPEGRLCSDGGNELRKKTAHLLTNMDLFFVKLSDFMYMVPSYPHLNNIKMSVRYKELPKPDGGRFDYWKQDYGGPGQPQRTYYRNGQVIGEDKVNIPVQGSRTPIPRPLPTGPLDPENGILRLSPLNPRYLELCRAQGLWHLLPPEEKDAATRANGRGLPFTSNSATMNGYTPSPSIPSDSGRSHQHYAEDGSGSPRPGSGSAEQQNIL